MFDSLGTGGAIVLGAALSLISGVVTEVIASFREDRRAKREADERHAQWNREDELRNEQQKREDQRLLREASQKLLSSASVLNTPNTSPAQQRQELREAYLEVKTFGSKAMADKADDLYKAADNYLFFINLEDENEDYDDYPNSDLEKAREAFLQEVSREMGSK